MNRAQFDAFIGEIKSRGFSNVLTGGGLQPIDSWRPYGVFSSNPGIEDHIAGFEWIDSNRAADLPVTNYPNSPSGVWTFS